MFRILWKKFKSISYWIVRFALLIVVHAITLIINLLYAPPKRKLPPLSVPCGDATEDCSEIRKQGPLLEEEISTFKIIEEYDTIDRSFARAARRYPNNDCLGSRKIIKINREKKVLDDGRVKEWEIYEYGDLKYETFSQVYKKVRNLGNGISHFSGLKSGERFAIYCETRKEWFITAQACFSRNYTIVTVYATLGEDGLTCALAETEVTTILVNGKDVKKLNNLHDKLPNLKYVIYVDEIPSPVPKEEDLNFKIISFEDLLKLGEDSKEIPVERPSEPQDLAFIMYTSGSTGLPKGVMLTHENILGCLGSFVINIGGVLETDTHLCYLPCAHIFECLAELLCVLHGGKNGYGNPRTLADTNALPCGDLRAVKPTIFVTVPRVIETIRKAAMEEIDKKGILVRLIFDMAFHSKYLAIKAGRETPFWDKLIFNTFREKIGGRARFLISGGAPLSPDAHKFMRVIAGCPVLQGYGLTETSACAIAQRAFWPFSYGNTGGPLYYMQVKLRDVPEAKYTHKGKYPRGEICLRGKPVCKQYFKRPELNKETFDEDGWFYTGDIGQMNPDGSYQIIDRKKNIVKLSFGEYVAVESLETIYGTSPFVAANGIMIYGDSFQDHLVAIVLPQQSYLMNWARARGISGDLESLCENPRVKKAVLRSFEEIAEKYKRHKFEYIKNITLLTDEWSPENGLLSSSLKLIRPSLKEKYKKVIEKMYKK